MAAASALSESWLAQVSALKDMGNSEFKAGQNKSAVISYKAAIEKAESLPSKDAATKEAARGLLVSLNSNLAAAQLKLQAWEAAVEAASAALALEPSHAKALFRRGTARAKLGGMSLGGARDDLLAACKADPRDKAARAALAEAQAALKANPYARPPHPQRYTTHTRARGDHPLDA